MGAVKCVHGWSASVEASPLTRPVASEREIFGAATGAGAIELVVIVTSLKTRRADGVRQERKVKR